MTREQYEDAISRLRTHHYSAVGTVEERDFYPDRPAGRPPYRMASLDVHGGPEYAAGLAALAFEVKGYLTCHTHGETGYWSIQLSRPLEDSEFHPDEVRWHTREVAS